VKKRIRIEVAPQKGNTAWPWKITADSVRMEEFPTQEAATRAATGVCKGLADAGKIVTLKIKLANGRIREERTYPRSSDPRSSKG
jgi:hypothetical protein